MKNNNYFVASQLKNSAWSPWESNIKERRILKFIEKGDLKKIQKYIKNYDININWQEPKSGSSFLHYASLCDQPKIAEYFINETDIMLDLTNKDGYVALWQAYNDSKTVYQVIKNSISKKPLLMEKSEDSSTELYEHDMQDDMALISEMSDVIFDSSTGNY